MKIFCSLRSRFQREEWSRNKLFYCLGHAKMWRKWQVERRERVRNGFCLSGLEIRVNFHFLVQKSCDSFACFLRIARSELMIKLRNFLFWLQLFEVLKYNLVQQLGFGAVFTALRVEINQVYFTLHSSKAREKGNASLSWTKIPVCWSSIKTSIWI